MKPQIISLLIILLSMLIQCRSAGIYSEAWEGISENTLKITISEFFPLDEDVTMEEIKALLTERLNQRASLIMASHLSINIPKDKSSRELDYTLNRLINDSITTGKVLDYDCSENNYCRAHGEYDITELQKNLFELNKQ